MRPGGEENLTREVEDPQTEIEQLSNHLREYAGIRRELFELKLWDKLSGASAAAITWGIIIFLGAISFFLLSAGVAWWIGMAIGRVYLGFLLVAGGLGLIAALVYMGKDKFLQRPLADRFVESLVAEEDEEVAEEDEQQSDEEHNQQNAA